MFTQLNDDMGLDLEADDDSTQHTDAAFSQMNAMDESAKRQSPLKKTLKKNSARLTAMSNRNNVGYQGGSDIISLMKDLQDQTSRLRADLEIKKDEIKELKRFIDTSTSDQSKFKSEEGTLPSLLTQQQGTKEARIIEMSKRIKKISIALERERAFSAGLAVKLKQFESLNVDAQNAPDPSILEEKSANELKLLKERLSQANRKVEEERMQTQAMKNEIRSLQKIIAAEIGEDVNISKLINNPGGWKGRAQQIAMLKDKVKELVAAQACFLDDSASMLEKETEKRKSPIRKIEQSKRLELEKAQEELQAYRILNAELKKKHDAAASRSKYLEKNLQSLKTKLELLIEKTNKDDKLIKALQEEMELRRESRSRSSDRMIDNLKTLCGEQKEQISRQEKQIALLREETRTFHSQVGGNSSDMSVVGYQATIRSLSNENERMRMGKKMLEEQLSRFEIAAEAAETA